MNTNHLKKFAQNARIKLLEQVEAKLNFVLTHDTAELRGKAETVRKLKEELTKIGQKALIDKVAYTWFNRLIALRFMDTNGYQPLGISIISPSGITNSVSPQILEEIHSGNFPSELKINRNEILDILDGRVNSNNPDNDVYKKLLVATCNQLSSSLPFLFERIDDYTELLLPDDLTSPFSIIRDVIQGMSQEDCSEVEIIGWLYQFYISEKKDEVFASKSAVKKEDIPAATQLFTPRWIVEYMVQNTVGKLWLQNKPNSKLRDHMPYFIESASLESEDYLKVNSVEEIKLLDQASGSGHILVYGFELFYMIYEEEGYNPIDIPELIVKNNLHGFEIDERAAQLSCFAISMKGRSLNRRYLSKQIEPNILCYQDISFTKDELVQVLTTTNLDKSSEFQHDLKLIEQATNLGSLILPRSSDSFLKNGLVEIEQALTKADIFGQDQLFRLEKAIKQLLPLSRKYHCIVDNPPYMGSGNMNKVLGDFVKTYYPDSKADLMACFMETGLNMLYPKGFIGMINQHSWMFLSSFERLRVKLVKGAFFDTNLHLGPRTFPEIGGEVVQNASFTFWNKQVVDSGVYVRLVDFNSTEEKRTKTLEAIGNQNCGWFYTANQKDFEKIPGSPIGYWLSKKQLNHFNAQTKFNYYSSASTGLATGNNEKYLRLWFEVESINENLNFSREMAKQSEKKWFPYNKGGSFRRWFGNRQYIVNWQNDGELLQTTPHPSGKRIWAHNFNLSRIFKKHIGWSDITSGGLSFRVYDDGFLFDSSGTAAFVEDDNYFKYFLGLLNTKYIQQLSKLLNPTLHFTPGDFSNLPAIINTDFVEIISDIVSSNIQISTDDWNKNEISWDFSKFDFNHRNTESLEESFDLYQQYWRNRFFQLHRNEEALNRHFLEIYGLQDELTPDISLDEITILKEETSIENGELVFHADAVLAQFVSYAVGCVFGRYSLDKEGLILAKQGETLFDYLERIEKRQEELSFIPDEDNIIPILDDEWFEDDIVARFYAFLKASFGEKEFQKNLAFIEECLGKDIRKYFVKDFYTDHIKRYKKRPIYWMFSSPKGSFNVLIYLHRYTPDTLNKILNSYLREFIEKLNLQRKQLEYIEVNGTPSEQSKAKKEIDKIDFKLADCKQYEAEILYPLASERIVLDLDEGVLVNYNKLGAAVELVPGLNDSKTKKKVKEFDWIDTTQIR
jgi:hypothetical protein